jgi:predicted lysophospholipase L1 biosynthesis ABC-type transport system permease subunit
VGEDLHDLRPLQDRRDDLQLAGATPRAAPQVGFEHALEQPRPADVLRPRLTLEARCEVVGAMVTLFAAVASRVGEIGTLRALGFKRGAVLVAFLGESLLRALVGSVVGLGGTTLMQTVNISTVNFRTLSELVFQSRKTGTIELRAPRVALAMGFVGSFVPAGRAVRLKIVDCLRAA